MKWIMSANHKYYNHEQAFKDNNYIDWVKRANFNIGDTVYIYTTKPIGRVQYKTQVIKTNMPFEQKTNDEQYHLNDNSNGNHEDEKYNRLELVSICDSELLSLDYLKDAGLSAAPQRPTRIQDELVEYIESVFDKNGKVIKATPKFRKIFTKTSEYKTLYPQISEELVEFENFSRTTSSKPNSSGMPRSYAHYLVYIAVFAQEYYDVSFDSVLTNENVDLVFSMRNKFPAAFSEYNESENHFPGATLNKFNEYLSFLKTEAEEKQDDLLNKKLSNSNLFSGTDTKRTAMGPKPKPEKQVRNKIESYPRDLNEALIAKERAGYTCEFDNNHTTFNLENGKKYVEMHHLIPMAQQDLFQYSIDIAANIVALCPNCHRQIHHATEDEKELIIKKAFDDRSDKLPNYGIHITYKDLVSYYN